MFKGRVNRWLFIITIVVAAVFAYTVWDEFTDDQNAVPVISFQEDSLTISVDDSEDVLLEGVTAYDEEDGDITESVVIESISDFLDDGSRTVTYAAFDSSDNVTKASRSIFYSDYESPQILLLKELTVMVGDQINIQDCVEARDVIDGNITSRLQIVESDYSQYYAGEYAVTLQVTNSAGDTEEVTYTIHCLEEEEETSNVSITLTDFSVYINVGDSFDAYDYIESISGYNYYGEELDESYVEIETQLDASAEGQYSVIYTLSSYTGEDSAELIVIVR